MEQFAWIFWIVLGVILIVAEILTLGFVLFWFGLGALAAALELKSALLKPTFQ